MTGALAAPGRRPRARAGAGGRLTLLDAYVLRLLATRSAAAFAVVFTVTMLERALRLATQMATAGAHLSFLPGMVLDLAPHYVALALPDAFLIGMLLTLSALDEDLEIEAMLAGGVSLGRIMAVLVAAGVVVAAANLAFLGAWEPLGLYRYRAAREAAVQAGWTAEVQPWFFQGRAGGVTLTADRTDASGRALEGLFVHRRSPDGDEIALTAPLAHLALRPDGRTATLDAVDGTVLMLRPGRRPVSGGFESYGLADPWPAGGRTLARESRPQERTLTELAGAAQGLAARSELAARLARTLALPVLPFLALPVAIAARRERRVLGLALAVGVALAFRQSVRLTQRLGEDGRVDPVWAMAAVFGVFCAVSGWLFRSNRRLHGDTRLAAWLQRLAEVLGRLRPPPAPPSARASVAGYLRRTVGLSALATWL
ncbi:MAG TPA: LptF/LptG family permease, partial [Caulobacteraceae bacterium]|nr:LptF/LptG family permease [Caulobacteraceae bacterium]